MSVSTQQSDLMTVQEVAAKLGVSTRQVHRLSQGCELEPAPLEKLKMRRPGGKRHLSRWRRRDVDRYIDGLSVR